eukprot:CAMPEP_0113890012 /NCGR_PEP_ID=MMETSP0780_2-20120614/13869_1 /TAXON_ID=652834 /ORGANISM="Palpitomonas bilix" /LENGTH=520 /DNA_ID=CAMNT_0000879281 /DNA_START=113 /DNA_END=1675 /DNA_ORIENTATION=- /assembly_acc=CAM_ASM_000599
MAYAYYKNGQHEKHAVFELFFRKSPFNGEFTIFAGLEECIRHIAHFKFTEEHIAHLKTIMPSAPEDEGFYDYLRNLDCSKLKLYSVPEGTVVFPRIPLLRVEGPLILGQLLETTFLALTNYPSLIATNAARMRLAAGEDKTLLEFGLRRAQGPDGGVSASRYSYLGGFDGTSNVLAGMLFSVLSKGTHAHAYVSSFVSSDDIQCDDIRTADGEKVNFVHLVKESRRALGFDQTNEGELAAFIAYAQAFPSGFLALVDTYDTVGSGVPNFLAVAVALFKIGYTPSGIRLDSGDLSYLSKKVRKMFKTAEEKTGFPVSKCTIVASNDIDEDTLHSLRAQGHEIDSFGIGTKLVTCAGQPALGCVYKLVEIDGKPRIKLSQDVTKVTIPGKKAVYRLLDGRDRPMLDLMQLEDDTAPEPGKRVLASHPFDETKRCHATPSKVVKLHTLVWDGGLAIDRLPTLDEIKERAKSQMNSLRRDHLRHLNPTPYKVSLAASLQVYFRRLWLDSAPIAELHGDTGMEED